MPVIKSISEDGDRVLVAEEGDVLRAYKCPAGFWTIGAGLTAASGVVKPKAGMVISREESRRLRRLALERNYAPAVVKTLPTDKQNVFDGALLFHFNTGAIARASWLGLFRSGRMAAAGQSFRSWNRGGGRVLNGLVKRRAREWRIIEFGNYGLGTASAASISDFSEHIHDFQALGYDTGKGAAATIVAFQRDHDLTPDGLIGPATRAAIARAKSVKTGNGVAKRGAAAGGAAGAGADVATAPPDAIIEPSMLLWIGGGALAVVALVLLAGWVWRQRGPLFAWLPEPVKDWFDGHGIVVGRRVATYSNAV